jgi:hypothetical protein
MGKDNVALSKANKAITVDINKGHSFTTTALRDTYFTSHPTELKEGLYIYCNGALQQRIGSAWTDRTLLIKGADGARGADGINGSDGSDGSDGLSAYQVWLSLGNTGTEANFIASLQGKDGIDGTNGIDGRTPVKGVDYFDGKDGASIANYVRITVTGASFAPIVELVSGSTATITWTLEETGTTYEGINPTMNFTVASTRHIRLSATKNGENALGDIITFNIGFNNGEDAPSGSHARVASSYNYSARQPVTYIEYLNTMTGLIRFLGATSTLTGVLDFSGMSQLEFIECYGASVIGVNLTGCTKLRRLCMENNNIVNFDLNPVANNLEDLRASGNGRGTHSVVFEPLKTGVTLSHLWHWCAQSETVINHATGTQLPVIEEWWDWASGQTGALVIRSSAIRNVASYNNGWTSVDVANQFPFGRNGNLDLHGCQIASAVLTNCSGLTNINLSNNNLGTDAINAILTEVNSWGTSNGTLNISNNVSPSNTDTVNLLTARGWTVTYDAVTEPTTVDKATLLSTIDTATSNSNSVSISTDGTDIATTVQWVSQATMDTYRNAIASAQTIYNNISATQSDVDNAVTTLNSATTTFNDARAYGTQVAESNILWQDTFDRADCTGVTNVGNGWYAFAVGGITPNCDISSGNLVTTWGDGYGLLMNGASGSLPADYTVSTTLPIGDKGHYFGLVGRWNSGTGVRLLFTTNDTTMTLGDAGTYQLNNVTLGTVNYPTNWTDTTITHTMAMQMVGTTITIISDGVVATTATININATTTGTSMGFCGEGHNRTRSEITVTSVT